MKKVILTIILSTGLVGLILTSCLCKKVPEYWMPQNMSANIISFETDAQPYTENDTVTEKSIKIELNFDHNYMAEINNNFNHFGNTAFASQKCPNQGYRGLKHNVTSFKFSSNKDFDTIPAGSDLSGLLYLHQEPMNYYFIETFRSTNDFISQGYSKKSLYFIVKNKPSNAESRYFTLTWTFDNNQVMSCDTQPIVW